MATLDGATGNSVTIDALTTSASTSYVAAVLNYSSLSDNLFVKIQDNDRNGLFDTVYFYRGNNGGNGSALVSSSGFNLSTEVASTLFTVTDNGDGTASALVQATGDTFGGTLANTYTGTGVGIGFFGSGQADSFSATSASEPVPEPMTILGTITALGFGAAFKRRQAKG